MTEVLEKLRPFTKFSNVEIKPSSYGGIGGFASKDLYNGSVVLEVPKIQVLSPRNTEIADFLVEEEEMGPSYQLILAFLYEKALGERSKWSSFISQICDAELPDIASLWDAKEKKLLKGTNINQWVSLDTSEMESMYNEASNALKILKKKTGHTVTFPDWVNASLIVSSRSFDVDDYHELSLVPGACIFNHSDKESLHFETDGNVCTNCGAIRCDCDSGWEEEDDTSIVNGHSDAHPGRLNVPGASPGGSEDGDVANICEMRLVRDVKCGEEIFNTYGDDPNAILLSRYGFAIWNNAHDVVDLEKELKAFSKANKLTKKVNNWKEKQEEMMDMNPEEMMLVGLMNNPPRYSTGLISLAKHLKKDVAAFAQSLCEARYQKYSITGTSSEIKEKMSIETSPRTKMALIAVGTEKLILETILNLQ